MYRNISSGHFLCLKDFFYLSQFYALKRRHVVIRLYVHLYVCSYVHSLFIAWPISRNILKGFELLHTNIQNSEINAIQGHRSTDSLTHFTLIAFSKYSVFYAPFWLRVGILLCCCLSVCRSVYWSLCMFTNSFRSFSSQWLHILKQNLVYRLIIRISRSNFVFGTIEQF